MPAGEYNITVDRGSTFKFHVTFYNSSETVVDLETYSASMQVRKSYTTENILLSVTGSTGDSNKGVVGGGSTGYFTGTGGVAGIGGIELNSSIAGVIGTTGGIFMSVDHVTMQNMPAGRHFYDLELTNLSDSTVTRILQGRFEVEAEVTR
jgi:hypothetical protein